MATVQKITPRSENFAQWYQDVIAAADLAEHAPVKGAMVIKPYGYAIWERLQSELDRHIKATGHQNAYFPLLIPQSYLEREKGHVEGFSPELAVVTHAGGQKLAEPLIVRPTSETIIYASFARWIESWRDLPLLINQWANVVRWELRPRLFLRTTEFLWQEGHTAHATEHEAEDEALTMLGVYRDVCERVLALPVLAGQKSDKEKFAGAIRTYTIELMAQDGKALQLGTAHNLGQNFARAFDVQFTTKSGTRQFVWGTSWGMTTRLVGGLILAHADDIGLVLPPALAPIQVVIVPIGGDKESTVLTAVAELADRLMAAGIRVHLDSRDWVTAGAKFHEWEKKGVPIRLDLGPNDLVRGEATLSRRDAKDKSAVGLNDLPKRLVGELESIQTELFGRATAFCLAHTRNATTLDELVAAIEDGFARAPWCGQSECEQKVAAETEASLRLLPFVDNQATSVPPNSSCAICGWPAKATAIWARAY